MDKQRAEHIMRVYRSFIIGTKRKWGSARGLVHYKGYVSAYLEAKRVVLGVVA